MVGRLPAGDSSRAILQNGISVERSLIPPREGLMKVPDGKRKTVELAIAETCCDHFQSVANQVEFYMLRNVRITGYDGFHVVKKVMVTDISLIVARGPGDHGILTG
jgi:hypothetical protein